MSEGFERFTDNNEAEADPIDEIMMNVTIWAHLPHTQHTKSVGGGGCTEKQAHQATNDTPIHPSPNHPHQTPPKVG